MSRAKTWPLVLPRQFSKHSNFVPGLLELHTARKSPCRAPGGMRGPGLGSPLGPPSQLSRQHPCPLPAACPALSPSMRLAHPLRVALGTGRSGGHTLMLESTRATRVVCAPRRTPACIGSPGKRPYMIGRPAEGTKTGLGRSQTCGVRVGAKNRLSPQTHCDRMKSAGRLTLSLVGVREAPEAVYSPGGDSSCRRAQQDPRDGPDNAAHQSLPAWCVCVCIPS